MKKDVWRAGTEIGFIIFLFYSNLLMGKFTHSGMGPGRGLAWAIEDIFTEVMLVEGNEGRRMKQSLGKLRLRNYIRIGLCSSRLRLRYVKP